jgi:hypothetical protein
MQTPPPQRSTTRVLETPMNLLLSPVRAFLSIMKNTCRHALRAIRPPQPGPSPSQAGEAAIPVEPASPVFTGSAALAFRKP